jgi:hypothetical protein
MKRSSLIAALAYMAVMTVWVYGVVNQNGVESTSWLLPVLAVVQVAAGFAVGRWWALALPLLLVAIAVPAGFPPTTPDNAEPFPIFFSIGFGALLGVPLIAVGLAARIVFDKYREAR